MGELAGVKRFPIGWPVKSRPCDACNTAAALLFCITDSSYMCTDCDSKFHGNNTYERVWMCEVCEHAPASVTCKADAAALCVRCDMDIHSANPLARRHERVPVATFRHAAVKSAATTILEVPVIHEDANLFGNQNFKTSPCQGHGETNNCKMSADLKSIELLFTDPDNLLEFDYPVPNNLSSLYCNDNPGADSVVPVQINSKPAATLPQSLSVMDRSADNHFEMDFTTSNIGSFGTSYAAQSISHNISSEVGVVPDGSCMSDISYPFSSQINMNVNANSCVNGNVQVSAGMDREARVMRYREKRKNRKFEKTIRYASRKAYAETRPRIKGRFAKRSENTEDVNRWFNSSQPTTNFMDNSGFGVVPSF